MNREPCKHVTLRAPKWPCPHPECSGGKTDSSFFLVEPTEEHPLQFLGGVFYAKQVPHYAQVKYRQHRFILDGEEYWGWRELKRS